MDKGKSTVKTDSIIVEVLGGYISITDFWEIINSPERAVPFCEEDTGKMGRPISIVEAIRLRLCQIDENLEVVCGCGHRVKACKIWNEPEYPCPFCRRVHSNSYLKAKAHAI